VFLEGLMCDPKYDVGSYDLPGAFLSTDLKGRAVYCQFPSDTILTFEYRDTRFQNLKIDQCIYVFEDEDGSKMIWAHYVDDIICGTTNRELNCVKTSSNIFVGVGILRTQVNSIGFLGLSSDVVMTKWNGQPQPPHILTVLSRDSI
jgi:hypothetical protein